MNTDDPEVPDTEINRESEGWPPEAKRFLDELYDKFGSKKDEQKYHVLLLTLGAVESQVSFSHDATVAQKVAMLEYEVLDNQGLIELALC